jgi:hypothetical protein
MKLDRDKILKALECCSLIGSESCDRCPLREACEDSPLASVVAERSLELIKDLLEENEKLIEQRDTFKEYALKMQALVENIKIKENEGYAFSAAKHAAEMDMWRVVAAEKRALQDENERLRRELYAKKST